MLIHTNLYIAQQKLFSQGYSLLGHDATHFGTQSTMLRGDLLLPTFILKRGVVCPSERLVPIYWPTQRYKSEFHN